MAKDLLNMDRLPTMEELKEQFKKNDWTTIQITDPAKRSEEERAEMAYVAAIIDKKSKPPAKPEA
ncbi:MAG: hypothetical protein J6J39_05465 [Clostridia bacterium]|nr:hypothetical protein [Clostridia bacterium]